MFVVESFSVRKDKRFEIVHVMQARQTANQPDLSLKDNRTPFVEKSPLNHLLSFSAALFATEVVSPNHYICECGIEVAANRDDKLLPRCAAILAMSALRLLLASILFPFVCLCDV